VDPHALPAAAADLVEINFAKMDLAVFVIVKAKKMHSM